MIHALALAFLAPQLSTAEIDAVLQRKGSLNGGVYRVTFPRRDLDVRIGTMRLEAGFALTTWAAFVPMAGHQSRFAMLMGDFVATESELPAAQSALLENGIGVTGVHNHVVGERPGIVYMHYSAKGEPAKLAGALLAALKTTGTPLGELSPPKAMREPDWSEVDAILGFKGARNGRVLNVSIPRADPILHEGEPLTAPSGANSSINLQWIEKDLAAITSDLVLIADEVEPVVRALHRAGITVTALHNHMLYDEPRTFHLHAWATGRPAELARGMRSALDRMKVKRP